uniref:Uncharacterized protein n=1 Tax=Anguilla anguilla TaxID=7936 RepID=A0A0E9RNZ4_ANGAN
MLICGRVVGSQTLPSVYALPLQPSVLFGNAASEKRG